MNRRLVRRRAEENGERDTEARTNLAYRVPLAGSDCCSVMAHPPPTGLSGWQPEFFGTLLSDTGPPFALLTR